jgi:7-cyano-7-deazaguanine synthase in queuosine biosynthesis
MAKDLAIVLNNGSINSAVITSLAAQKYRLILIYAQGNDGEARRRAAYEQQVAHFKPYREHTVTLGSASPTGSAANSSSVVSDPRHPAPLGPQMLDLLPLVSTAVLHAANYQAAAIYIGLRVGGQGDEMAQATEYLQIWSEMVQLPCGQTELEITAPLLELETWQVVDVGFQAGAPFEKTWSCMEEGPDPCWGCRACRARESAFHQAAKPDPTRQVKKM